MQYRLHLRSIALGHPPSQHEYAIQRYVQLRRQPLHGLQRRVAHTPLDTADIRSIHSGVQRESLLTDAKLLAHVPEGRANVGSDVHSMMLGT